MADHLEHRPSSKPKRSRVDPFEATSDSTGTNLSDLQAGVAALAAATTSRFTGTADPIGTTNVVGGQEGGAAAPQVQPPSPAQPQSGAPTGGQPGPQQATQGQMASTSTAIPMRSAKPDTEWYRYLVQQLVLLMHANECRGKRQVNGEMIQCTLPYCKTMKDLLHHMMICQSGRYCKVLNCSLSKQTLNHYEHCKRPSDCPVCSTVKQIIKNGLTKQLDIFPALRNHLFKRVFQAIRQTDPQIIRDKRIQNFLAYAKKVEGDVYEMAKSRPEYIRLLADKVWEIQKKLDEMRQEPDKNYECNEATVAAATDEYNQARMHTLDAFVRCTNLIEACLNNLRKDLDETVMIIMMRKL